jgi:hypothetical protein
MAKAEINAGICGFCTSVETHLDEDNQCHISIQSNCPNIQKLAEELKAVNPFKEISYRRGQPLTLETAARICPHTACPVPVGIIKAIEVEAGLALPADVTILVSKE